ncbi:MAG: prepilin-type N-terminal cleavage/methylation domain-containing protein [Candidatus Eremiobacteraeota bacterium]|nr:prepilin-type N-terminal cleavage/methylation domain-containing protein [Candidatus Eremiobacteraeota bacterium]
MRESQAGFTLVELMIGAAITAIVIGALVAFASRLTLTTTALGARVQSQSAAERLMERLTTEAASAWAVYVPSTDVNGNANADGHEIDFFSEDGSHRPYSWSYTFDATHQQITRYAYAPGAPASPGETIGPVDRFTATTVSVTQLGSVDPLFAGATATPVSYGFDTAASAVGGNALVQLQIRSFGVDRSELLASGTAPTTFTVIVNYTPSPTPVATATPFPLLMTPATP